MLIPPRILRKLLNVEPTSVLHVGAHKAEELPLYRQAQFGPTVWVEAQADLINALRKTVESSGDVVVHACAWSESGIPMTLQISNNGESSSLFDLGTHRTEHPNICMVREEKVVTSRLRDAVPSGYGFDFVNLDIQGAELEALKGMGDLLDSVRWVYTEVNREELYIGIPRVDELTEWLGRRGLARACVAWTKHNWGDALFIRRSQLTFIQKLLMPSQALMVIFWYRSFPLRKITKKMKRNLRTAWSVFKGAGSPGKQANLSRYQPPA